MSVSQKTYHCNACQDTRIYKESLFGREVDCPICVQHLFQPPVICQPPFRKKEEYVDRLEKEYMQEYMDLCGEYDPDRGGGFL